MRVLSVEPKDICVTCELSMKQVRFILDFLDRSEVSYSSEEEPLFKDAVEYVKNDFFKTLERLYEQFSKEVI